MAERFDVVVVGGGPAGENAAWYARDNGLSAALVERELVGGECSYWACMPSKALLRPGEILAEARRVPGAAAAVTGDVDVATALDKRDEAISNLDDKYQVQWMNSVDVPLFRGVGSIQGERSVTVRSSDGTVTELEATKAVIVATGSLTKVPDIEGLGAISFWDNRDVTTVTSIPQRLVIVGAGVVAVEMAQAMRRLGCREVTIVGRSGLLDREEPFVGEILGAALEEGGIRVLTQTSTSSVERDGETGPVTLTLGDGSHVTADELLLATGREPRTADLGLENVGLEPGKVIAVDDQLRATGVAGGWLYAVGDVNGRALLTHQGKYQARVVADVIAGRDDLTAWADNTAVPRVIFTDPQVGAVGLTEVQAREAGINVKILTVDIGSVAAASLIGKDTVGKAQLVLDVDRNVIVGATFVGPHVGELLHSATVALVGEVPIDRLWHAVPSFPTLSELWLRLLEAHRGIT